MRVCACVFGHEYLDAHGGETPLVDLKKLIPAEVTFFAKS